MANGSGIVLTDSFTFNPAVDESLKLHQTFQKAELPTVANGSGIVLTDSFTFNPAVDESLKLHQTFQKAELPSGG
ncbi:MAG: hypothetical protein IJZ54_03825 [Clostridia bacterium]|nr:hypothetical protein [Clostridia bacterium]